MGFPVRSLSSNGLEVDMDLWVVGAAAAAGYIAKYWQNVQKDRDNSSESGPSNREKQELPSCPIRRRLSGKKKQTEEVSTSMNDRNSNENKLDSVSVYVENPGSSGNRNYSDMPSFSSLPLGFSTNHVPEENNDKFGLASKVGDDFGRICTGQVDFFRDSAKKRSLRTKYGCSIKPLTSLESCLFAQLYQEHSKMEEYMLSVFQSTSTTTRTLLVTDGNQIISRATRDSVSIEINADDRLFMEGNVVNSFDALNKIKSMMRKGQHERSRSSYKADSGRRFVSQLGLPDQSFLFCLGISVGIIASLVSSGREIDELKDQLKQRENLVQDLQEELEMKDSLTVKELAEENSESQDTFEKRITLTNYYGKESQYERADETSEDMSKIEAELEAELERLGLNISTSAQEGKLSDLVELDPNFVVDFAEGELREDMVNSQAVAEPDSDKDASCTSRIPTGNYAVSPRELSLRLHEVIESRLEEHVKNLEQALQSSEMKVRLMEESQQNNVLSKLSGSKLRYSSGEESPISEQDFNAMARPLVMNLSGEALDAYNEACEELTKADEYNRHGPQELLYDGISEGENSDSNDEMELIKQIMEKTRKGSPAMLNAQRLLFSINKIEY